MEHSVEQLRLLKRIAEAVEHTAHAVARIERWFISTVLTGGTLRQIGNPMVPIQPGQTPVFQVAPTFSGASFATVAAQAAVSSSDPANFPVELVSTDPTGLTFQAPIPSTAEPTDRDEAITVTWTYTNLDGTVATVTGTVTELGIVDDVTGGTFAQIV